MADVFLQWDDNANDELSYSVERQLNGGGFVLIEDGTLPPDQDLYQDPDVPPGTYDYQVYASNVDGDSAKSNISQIVVPVTGPVVVMEDNFGPPDGAATGRIPDTTQYLSNAWYELRANLFEVSGGQLALSATQNTFNALYYNVDSADMVVTIDITATGDTGSRSMGVSVRNIAPDSATVPTWHTRVNTGTAAPITEIQEDGVVRASTPLALSSVGNLAVTCEAQTITAVWNSASDTDITTIWASAVQGETTANAGPTAQRSFQKFNSFKVET